MQRLAIALLTVLVTLLPSRPAAAQERGAAALGSLVDGLGVTARVLMIGAHPDDEDTFLLAWLARAQHVETAYLSLTRGDGGQNLIGNELGQGLGAIRTEELLAARRIDGARQYFTRAYDFGFSKSAEETYRHWPRDSILRDVVTVVRAFRPHVIIAVFSGTSRDGHGHHQVSGIMAREAYAVSADTVRFPRSATAGEGGWTPLKLYQTARFNPQQATIGVNVGAYDPLMGRTYADLAAESRSQHKSQGFGTLERRGNVRGYLRREATRVPAPENASDERSIFDGIDTGWERIEPLVTDRPARSALDSLPAAVTATRRRLDLFEPNSVIDPLVRVQRLLARVCGGSGVEPCTSTSNANGALERRLHPDVERSVRGQGERVNRALLVASGVLVEITAGREAWPAEGTITAELGVYNRGALPVELGIDERWDGARHVIAPDSAVRVPAGLPTGPLTQPWWLVRPQRTDIFAVPLDAQSEDARPDGPWMGILLRVGGGEMVARVPLVHRYGDPVRGEVQRPLAIVPPIAVTVDREVTYAPANAAIDREVRVTLRSSLEGLRTALVRLRLPDGLVADPSSQTVMLTGADATRTVAFRVRGRVPAGRHQIEAVAESNGETFRSGYVLIDYDHIRPRRLYRDAAIALQAVDVRLPPGLTVAYIPGVGDNVAPMLEQLGIPVTMIDPATIDGTTLSRYRAVVVGPRAYESQPALVERNQHLLDYARQGGTVVAQYGQYEMQREGILPYRITLSRPHARVTEEDAPVRVLAEDHPLLTTPNRIGAGDFEGWVQERSLYMPVEAAPEYVKLLSLNDPGEPANDNSILVARHGSGMYVYTTLAFFRQLPAGNPGAARLFVNLLGAGETVRP